MQRFSRVSFRKIALVLVILLTGFYLANYSGFLRSSSSPGLQVKDPYNDQLTATNFKRRQAVREATKHAWSAYKQFAWGRDELRPISGNYSTGWGGWAITLVDSLDTLRLMELDKDYDEAKDFVRTMQFDRTTEGFETPVFEMTIRALGGLLGAYELDNDPMLLRQAKQVADSLSYAFNTKSGLPAAFVDVNRKTVFLDDYICIAEAGTLQLEFKKLSQLTGDDKYAKLVENASEVLERAEKRHSGLYPSFINVHTGEFNQSSSLSVGAYADSFYEYLLKQYILHDGKEPKFKDRYVASVEAIKDKLVKKSDSGYYYLGRIYENET
ncbi:Endoplasmic reticulum mannosyl-oligosaccharide 1,2-alpha-mannosidase, partial [Coemansia sp. RSA 2320]